MSSPKSDRILIIGAGVFGLSTALELAKRGRTDITVLDRSLPPVPDGSSVDISRVIRPDYADEFYARMGLDALQGWKGEYAPFFHQSGLLCLQSQGSIQHTYLEQSKQNLERLGASLDIRVSRGREANEKYPGIHGNLENTSGYWNESSGWADAEGSILFLARQCTAVGVSFLAGRQGTVTKLITSIVDGKSRVTGVRTLSNAVVPADTVILATGAWTFHLIDMGPRALATAQPVAFMQLTPEEATEMANCPVMIDLSTGWFAFPPTPGTHILKMARHGYGYEAKQGPSAPKLTSQQRPFLPADAEGALRDGLALFLPRFKDRPFVQRRLCWYTDTPKGDFIVDYHPEFENLFFATGGSGQ